MASMIAGGLFNAVAFGLSNYLFSKLSKSEHDDETQRHDKAMGKLSQAKEDFYERETKRKNREAELKEELYNAKYDMKDTDKAFKELNQILLQQEKMPELSDFYQPSDEMKKYKNDCYKYYWWWWWMVTTQINIKKNS